MEHYQEEDLVRIKELLRHTSEFIAYFELIETKMMEWRQDIEQHASGLLHQQEKLNALMEKSLDKIENHGTQVVQRISNEANHYDLSQFQKIAQESCEQVKQSANDAMTKTNKFLYIFQFRLVFFALIATFVTVFLTVLYLSGELPWEMHHQAKNERKLGKALLQAWPNLSKEEKTKIMGYINNS